MVRHRSGRIDFVAAAAILVSCALTTPALAQVGSNRAYQATMHAATAPLHVVVAELRHTHALLAQANHDYQGHRAKAHAEVGRAIHLLQRHPHYHHHHPALSARNANPRPRQPAVHEPQQVSDAQMTQSGQQLQVILTQLATLQTNPLLSHHHIGAAGNNVQQAIQHVQTALAVSPARKQ
jgi:hypothetical protein